ncbi:TorF family putative porin [Xanthobacter sp. TB0139]|uniref:TorF family putative porin n=1 Tax=Xanthobacter sp. TB0139 TaxID=3459178 RepID=UPI00403A4AEB
MKKIALAAVSSLLISGTAFAADMSMPVKAVEPAAPAPLWDVSFGVTGASDYVFRGVSQTNGNAAIQGYAELSLFDWVYLGAWGSNVSFLGSGSAEVDLYAGVRHTWDKLTLDAGFTGYTYPGSDADTDLNYWEIYFKPSYQVTDWLNVGMHLYWTSDFAATNTDGTYLAGTAEVALPSFGPGEAIGWHISGEYGYQWLDSAAWNGTFFTPITLTPYYVDLSGYSYWNVGVGFTYKAATLDLRYHGSDLSDDQCVLMIGNSNDCGDRFLASLSFDVAFSDLK